MFIVYPDGTIRSNFQCQQIAESGYQQIAGSLRFHHEKSSGSSEKRLADILRFHYVFHSLIAGKESAGVQTVLVCAAYFKDVDLAWDGWSDSDFPAAAGSGGVGDKDTFTAGQPPADGTKHAAQPLFAAVHLSFQHHVRKIGHGAVFDFDGFSVL